MGGRRDMPSSVLAILCAHHDAILRVNDRGDVELRRGHAAKKVPMQAAQLNELIGRGLLAEREPGGFGATADAGAWLRRAAAAAAGGDGFRAQHSAIGVSAGETPAAKVLVNLDESPVATLARPRGGIAPWLAPHAATAAERLRRDFELAHLQPRITANLSVPVHGRRRQHAGPSDLADSAVAARQRIDRALRAVGPELSGVLLDVCCFLKGLETVERERCWPARSAKLVLRLALEALARHYGLASSATGGIGSRKMRQWGTADYRPVIS